MSELLNSGYIRNSRPLKEEDIIKKWKDIGFLDGLDYEMRARVALGMEVAAQMLIIEGMIEDLDNKLSEKESDDHKYYETIMFPIVRRVVTGCPEAYRSPCRH